MLTLLHIENVAVIARTDVEFGGGLNVMTGETGAVNPSSLMRSALS